MGNYNEITIIDAMDRIAHNRFLLPALQRKFVWNEEQMELLFDSILRGYPINTFMLWKVTSDVPKTNNKFYSFILNYVERFGEDNSEAPTTIMKEDFCAVIDGQQRLNSLYIGLAGTYKVIRPRCKNVENNDKCLVEKVLYLEITSLLNPDTNNGKLYNFRFMSIDEKEKDEKDNQTHFWFPMNDPSKLKTVGIIDDYIKNNNLSDNENVKNILMKIHRCIFEDKLVSYYETDEQDLDIVLELFVRSNSGGTPLSFANLLMSVATANWREFNAKEEIEDLRKQIYTFGSPNFEVSQDYILKTMLVLLNDDVRFKINNFTKDKIKGFEHNWQPFKLAVLATFNLLDNLGFNNVTLRALNASIPIAHYIYKKKIGELILHGKYKNNDEKKNISTWLSLTLLSGIFGGNSDSVLRSMKNVIEKGKYDTFPKELLISEFDGNQKKSYLFDIHFVDKLLDAQYGSANAGLILGLLYPQVLLNNGNNVAQDHMHPKSFFEKKENLKNITPADKDIDFYKDKKIYNSILNLQLLSASDNNTKSDTPLKKWAETNNRTSIDLYIHENTDTSIEYFKSFISARREVLKKKICELLKIVINDKDIDS